MSPRKRLRPRVGAVLPPGEEDVKALPRLFEKGEDRLRLVLKVAVHDHDPIARGMVEAGGESVVLSTITAQADALGVGIIPANRLDHLPVAAGA